jgi:hypothetical protein
MALIYSRESRYRSQHTKCVSRSSKNCCSGMNCVRVNYSRRDINAAQFNRLNALDASSTELISGTSRLEIAAEDTQNSLRGLEHVIISRFENEGSKMALLLTQMRSSQADMQELVSEAPLNQRANEINSNNYRKNRINASWTCKCP